MSVHLVGGGWQDAPDGAEYAEFIAEASARAAASGRDVPRIAVVSIRDGDGDDHAAKLIAASSPAGAFEPHITAVDHHGGVPATAFADVDGILVGGGLTPVYRELLEPHFGEIRRQVADGVPYLGFSAGAAIAADSAILGGWRIGDVPVCPEEAGEDLDEVTVAEGLALVDLAVDAHAVQWGTLARVIAATEAGILDGAVAIDESTVLIVGDGALRVEGRGNVWQVSEDSAGVLVRTVGS